MLFRSAGAPGDGPRTMQRSMAYVLDKRGLKVAESPNGDPAPTLVLQGAMKVETRNARSHVEIVWTLKRPDGTELGTVAQANDLPAEMLQRPWGDIAFSIADAAADGIADLVAKTTTPPPAADDSP